jgi:5-methylthioadenosine/S-adenosylhomocysteine deaminase
MGLQVGFSRLSAVGEGLAPSRCRIGRPRTERRRPPERPRDATCGGSARRKRPPLRSLSIAVAALLLLAAVRAKKESADLVVTGARLVTVDEKFSLYDPGGMAVAGGKILAVGPSAEIERRFSARLHYDARGSIVMPGLVNTHTHAAMNLLRGIADDLPLEKWLTEHIFPAEAKNVSPEFVYDGTLEAALEMIESGTTTFADMYYFEADAARAVEKAGLRAVLGETFIDFPVPDHKDLASTLAYMEKYVARWKGNPRITPAVAPHAPYTCSRETLLAARDFALREGLPILIHVAETKKELEDARRNWQQTPFLRLASLGFFEPAGDGRRVPIVAAHAVWADEKDRDLARRFGVAFSHNPESNMKLASGIADVAAWQKEGTVWGLGTDGVAGSNNDLSMFEAMDFAGKLAKVAKEDPTVLSARELLAAATRGGARALGLAQMIGTLEPGKRADFIAVDVGNAHVQPLSEAGAAGVSADSIYSAIVYSVKASDVTDVWVDGRPLLTNRSPTTLNAREVLASAARWREKVQKSLAP